MSIGFNSPLRPTEELAAAAQGLIAQNMDRQSVGNGQVLVDGTVYLMLVGLREGQIVTGASIVVSSSGSSVTLSKLGLYSTAGTRLAVTADQGTAWQSTGTKSPSFTSTYTVTSSGGYYVAVVAKASTTLPTLIRGTGDATQATVVGSGSLPFASVASQTDLPSSLTVAAGGAPKALWVGLF